MDFFKPPPDNSAHIISTPIITPTLTTRVQLPMPREFNENCAGFFLI